MTTPNTNGEQFPQQGEPTDWQGTAASDRQYAQPGYQQGQPHAGAAAGQPLQAEPPRSKGGVVGRIVKAVVVIVVLVAVGLVARGFFTGALNSYAELEVGKCIVFEGTESELKHKGVECDDPTVFKYQIAKIFDENDSNDCRDDYGWYAIEKDVFGTTQTVKTVCMVEKFEVDACYEQVEGVEDFKVISCPAELSAKQFRVTKVIEEAGAACAEDELSVTYPEPALTYCVAAS